MSDENKAIISENKPESKLKKLSLRTIGVFLDIFSAIFSLILLVPRTIFVLMPSSTRNTSSEERSYSKDMNKTFVSMIENLTLDVPEKEAIKKNWLEQIEWSDGRANRERDANELIRWWQIILSVLVPVFAQAQQTFLVSLFGVLVAVMTSIHEFRRPDERWRHYRVLTERYQIELWNYINLSSEIYQQKENDESATHKNKYKKFDERMTEIRKEDINKFFNDITGPNQKNNPNNPSLPPGE